MPDARPVISGSGEGTSGKSQKEGEFSLITKYAASMATHFREVEEGQSRGAVLARRGQCYGNIAYCGIFVRKYSDAPATSELEYLESIRNEVVLK